MASAREEANNLYRSGRLQEAHAAYTECLANAEKATPMDEAEVAKLHNNLSVCSNAMKDTATAAWHARQCVSLDPTHGKAHLRLVTLCPEDPAAERHLELAAALLGSSHAEVRPLLQQKKMEKVQFTLVRTSTDAQQQAREVQRKLLMQSGLGGTQHYVLVFAPGRYELVQQEGDPILCVAGQHARLKIRGLGPVTLVKGVHNALWVAKGGQAEVEGVAVEEKVENPTGAGFAVDGTHSVLSVFNCQFACVGGLTASDGATLCVRGCVFQRAQNMGIELRGYGNIDIVESSFKECARCISAAAKTGSITVVGCSFSGAKKEAVQLDGCRPHAAAREKDEESRKAKRRMQCDRTTTEAEAEAWSFMANVADENRERMRRLRATGQPLTTRMQRCHVQGAGFQGISCGDGARLELLTCVFESVQGDPEVMKRNVESELWGLLGSNKALHPMMQQMIEEQMQNPGLGAALHVRGGGSVSASSCVFADNRTAVNVDYNFDGDVVLRSCSFGRNKRDVAESTGLATKEMWSKPAVIEDKQTLPNKVLICDVLQALEAGHSKAPLQRSSSQSAAESACSIETSEAKPVKVTVGKEDLSVVPARMPLFTMYSDYYAIGNTFGRDLSEAGVEVSSQALGCTAIMLLACGDARNAFETIAGWWQRVGAVSEVASLKLTMNDVCSSVLLRNAMLLELCTQDASAEVLAEVWGAAMLSTESHESMLRALQSVGSSSWANTSAVPDWDRVSKAWLSATTTAKELQQILSSRRMLNADTLLLSQQAVGAEHSDELRVYLAELAFKFSAASSDSEKKHANVTLLEGSGLKPTLYFSSSIFRAIGPLKAKKGELTKALLKQLASLSAAVQPALESGRVMVDFVAMDAFMLLGRDHDRYAVVDTSNLADYVGFPNALLLGARFGEKVLAQTMQLKQELSEPEQRRAYFKTSCGVELSAFEDIAALKMRSEVFDASGTLWTEWSSSPRPQPPVQRALAAAAMAKNMCNANRSYLRGGGASASAATVAALVGPKMSQQFADVYPWAADELRLLEDGSGRVFRLRAEADTFVTSVHLSAVLAVAVLEDGSFEVGDKVKAKPMALLHMVEWNRDIEEAVFLAPAGFKDRWGDLLAMLVACDDKDTTCLSWPCCVADIEELGVGPNLFELCRFASDYPDGGTWAVHRKELSSDGASFSIDISMPKGLRGLSVEAHGQHVVFTVAGEKQYEVEVEVELGERLKAQMSAPAGLASCTFAVKRMR